MKRIKSWASRWMARTGRRQCKSPLLANIYLHYVLDLWAQQWRNRHAQGDVIIVRFAKAGRNTVILRLSRLACPPSLWRGWTQEKISETVGINQQRISQITNNTNFSEIGNLLSQGHDMDYIARHYHFTKSGDLVLCALSSDLRSLTSDLRHLSLALRPLIYDPWPLSPR